MTVIVSDDRLVVRSARANYEGIVAAMEIGRRALDDLPRTPFLAAGVNLRYKSDTPVAVLEEITANAWDNRLSDEQFEIQERTVSRMIRRANGRINVTITQRANQTFSLGLNFDLQSDDVQQLHDWLNISRQEIQQTSERILYNSIGVQREELTHD
jgi:hypothetical protein